MNEILNMTIGQMPLTEFDCSCGRHHSFPVHDISIRPGAIEDLPAMAEPFRDGTLLVVFDNNTYEVAGRKAVELLRGAGFRVKEVLFDCGDDILIPDEATLGRIVLEQELDTSLMVAVGSGVINDSVKFVTSRNGLPYIVVGTAPVYGTMFTTNDQSIADKNSELFAKCNRYRLAAIDMGGKAKSDYLATQGSDKLAAKVAAWSRTAPASYDNSGWYVGSAGQWCQMMSDLTGNTAFLNNWKANDKEPNWNNRGVDANIKGTLIGEYRLGKVTSDYYSWGNSQLITTSSVGTGGNFIAFAFAGNGNTYAYLTTIANTTNGWTFPIYSF